METTNWWQTGSCKEWRSKTPGNLASSTVFMDQELRNVIELGYSIEMLKPCLQKHLLHLYLMSTCEDYVIVDRI